MFLSRAVSFYLGVAQTSGHLCPTLHPLASSGVPRPKGEQAFKTLPPGPGVTRMQDRLGSPHRWTDALPAGLLVLLAAVDSC